MSSTTMLRARGERLACAGAIVAGAVFVVLAYTGVKGTPVPADGFTYLASGAVAGLYCLAVGAGGLVCAGLYDEWRKLDRIELAGQGRPLPDPEEVRDAPPGPVALHTRRDAGPDTVALRLDWTEDGLRRGLLVTAGALAVSAVPVITGWRIAARTLDMSDSARGLAIGIIGLVLATVVMAGHVVWLRSRLIDRKRSLLGPYLRRDELPAGAPIESDGAAGPGGKVVVTATSRRFHRPGCAMVDGADAATISRLKVGDRQPCGICRAE